MPDAPFRYKKLGYVAINVTDLDRSVKYYRDTVGMEVSEVRKNEVAFMRCDEHHHSLAFYPSKTPGLKRVAFEVESDADLDAARAHLKKLGVPVEEVSAEEAALLKHKQSLRFSVPGCGLTLELYSGPIKVDHPYVPTVADILRLGHLVVQISHFDTTFPWLTEHFGFRVSDHTKPETGGRGEIAFLRCHPNPYHHSIGIARSDHNQLHHYAFMVGSIDDIGRGVNRLPKEGGEIVFGPGRHLASGSIFLYYLDPDDITIEYTHGMEEFSEHTPRDTRKLKPTLETVDLWGGVPRPKFGKVGYIEEMTG